MAYGMKTYKCACQFAKTLDEKDPTQFPRIGMADNILYRGGFIVQHLPSSTEAIIRDPKKPALHAEADECCFAWFTPPRKECE